MMRDVPQKIQLAANVAIVMVAVLLGGVLVTRYLYQPKPAGAEARAETRLKPGTKLSLSGVDWSKSERNLLLVLSTQCHYCTESAPFYQRLGEQKATRRDVYTIALLPQTISDSVKYLTENKIVVDEVRQAAPASVFANGTPTLILADENGAVINSWVGKLSQDKEAEVLAAVLNSQK